jgi:hypothetical protein
MIPPIMIPTSYPLASLEIGNSISLTPPKGSPLPPTPPLPVELAARPLTLEVLDTEAKEVTRPG